MSRWHRESIDVILQQSPVRVLRALRFCGWIDVYDLRELVLDCAHEDQRSKDAIATALIRMAKSGLIEKRSARHRGSYVGSESHCYELRITLAGRAWLAKKLAHDAREEFAPARPGTEHFLCA